MYVYLLPKLPLLKITYHSNVTFPTVKCQRRHCRRYTQQNCTVQRSRVGLQSSQLILVFMLFHSPHNDNVSSVTCLLSVTIMMTKTICQSHSKLSLRGKAWIYYGTVMWNYKEGKNIRGWKNVHCTHTCLICHWQCKSGLSLHSTPRCSVQQIQTTVQGHRVSFTKISSIYY